MAQKIHQDPLGYSVQIRNATHERLVGTGVAVSLDGKIVTCAHVVEAAGVNPKKPGDQTVGIYFPQTKGGEQKERQARVIAWFPQHDDDVVLLELTGGPPPLSPDEIGILGTAQESSLNDFVGLGFSPIGKYESRLATGKIAGYVFPPQGAKLHGNPVQLKTTDVRPGMSGAGVLDRQRNLIIGLITERWNPGDSLQDNDLGYATDSRILTFDPFFLPVQGEALPLKEGTLLNTDFEKVHSTTGPKARFSWNNAPKPLDEWVGRTELLKNITADWDNPNTHITSLIGFGGEGKSSLARQWVEQLLQDTARSQPDAVFWWGFYENRSVDEFFEAALKYVSGERIDPREFQSSNSKARFIAAMLATRKFLFILDGFEVMQYQEGDQFGQIQNNDLKEFMRYFATYDHQSFCMITSRAPLLDLVKYASFNHRDVDRLLPADGRALLNRLGVNGTDTQLDKVVVDWDGHALTISLLGSYLAEKYGGDIAHLADIPIPTADEPRYERVHRVLRRYDDHLTEEEREFLKLFSVFRLPVQESAFEKVFEPLLKSLDKDEIQKLVSRLANYRLIRHDEHEKSYTTHPLIRNHYFALFTKGDPSQEKAAHEQIKDYYISIAGDTPHFPTLNDLKPLIEVVHHACQAGAYDEAFDPLFWQRVYQGERRVVTTQLGAYETCLSLLTEFFPFNDTLKESLVSDNNAKLFILSQIGMCLMSLGHLRDAVSFYERVAQVYLSDENLEFAGRIYQNLAELQTRLGALDASAEAAHQALAFARKAEKKGDQCSSLAFQGLANHLLGNVQVAGDDFSQAERLEQEVDSSKRYLYSLRGLQHTDHLRRTGDMNYARRVAEANLQICERNHWANQISWCHRLLGDLDSDSGNHGSARVHFESALKIARGIQRRDVLIEALLARGRSQAKYLNDANAAFSDLNEALGYCVESSYRIYEADVRVALGWAYLANGEKEKAKQSAQRALQMSQEMGYHWGKVDAKEVLERIEE